MAGVATQPQFTSPRVASRSLNKQIHGLRGFSALGVFICHIYGMSVLWHFWPAVLSPAASFFHAGAYGVEIFFVISGYLITASLLRHQSAGKFLIDRCIRIYPVFLTIHLLVFGAGPIIGYKWMAGISPSKWLLSFISNLLFLPGLFNLPIAQLNAWSLSYEAAFYLMSAIVFVMSRIAGRRNTMVGLALILLPFLAIYTAAAFFLVGVAVFFLTDRWNLKPPVWLRILSVPAILSVLMFLEVSQRRSVFVISLLPAFIFFWNIVEGKCALSWFLRARWLQYLGTISYSFYLWSPAVTYPMKILVGKVLHGRANDVVLLCVFAVVAFTTALVVSHVSYVILEDRAGRTLRRLVHERNSRRSEELSRVQVLELTDSG
jgi:peptidoglycan/LPS O-acetylase OafA/YrhL